jgi:sugar/nucleoside kinase (ribokinase family)
MRTAVAAVVQLKDSSILFGTRDIRAPQLDPSDIYGMADVITGARTVQLTFEAPYQITNAILDVVRKASNARPTVVVTPSPPYERPDLDQSNFACIDVMVARDWEITALTGKESANTEELAQSLRQLGVGYLCLLTPGTCLSYGPAGAVAVPPITKQARKNSGERGAFCAALAKKLGSPPVIDEGVLVWASAAMTLASLSHGVAEAMPTEAEVTSFLERYG